MNTVNTSIQNAPINVVIYPENFRSHFMVLYSEIATLMKLHHNNPVYMHELNTMYERILFIQANVLSADPKHLETFKLASQELVELEERCRELIDLFP